MNRINGDACKENWVDDSKMTAVASMDGWYAVIRAEEQQMV